MKSTFIEPMIGKRALDLNGLPMRVLYIVRDQGRSHGLPYRLARWSLGLVDGQDGFFEAALHSGTNVTRVPLSVALKLPRLARGFDAVVVNMKCGLNWRDPSAFQPLLKRFPITTALFLGNAEPHNIPDDNVFDLFDVIFKREPFIDLDRYEIGATSKSKIKPTNLSNPFIKRSFRWLNNELGAPKPTFGWAHDKAYDTSFAGRVTPRHRLRDACWEALVDRDHGLTFVGGLQDKAGIEIPERLRAPRYSMQEYLQLILQTRVNLAIDGIGPFTFRHLELFWAGAFVLSHKNVSEVWLRVPMVDNRDYVSFSAPDDMIEKIKHYLHRPDEMAKIAQNGRKFFEHLYDHHAHGLELAAALRGNS